MADRFRAQNNLCFADGRPLQNKIVFGKIGNYFSVFVANRCQRLPFSPRPRFSRRLRLLILLWLRLLRGQTPGGHQKEKENSNEDFSHGNSHDFPENSQMSSRFFA
jgi:hypothetical protein